MLGYQRAEEGVSMLAGSAQHRGLSFLPQLFERPETAEGGRPFAWPQLLLLGVVLIVPPAISLYLSLPGIHRLPARRLA